MQGILKHLLLATLLYLSAASRYGIDTDGMSPEEILELADETLSSNDPVAAIKFYDQGIALFNEEDDSILTGLSLYTNAGTAYSTRGDEVKAVGMYRNAIMLFSNQIDDIVVESMNKSATDIAAQAAFFLGMSHEAMESYRKAADSYAFAASLDSYHWAGM
jgi:tetratricopeptide (TPR) repeat protein